MRLPSMHALMIFETAGRYESFLEAAKELNVTPSAVSRQIKILESQLNIALFKRTSRKVTLTQDGKVFWSAITRDFSDIRDKTRTLLAGDLDRSLTIWCSMVLMRYWLLPRIQGFYDIHPDLNITFRIGHWEKRVRTQDFCAIAVNDAEFGGRKSDYLFDAESIVVCSPRYLDRSPPIRSIDDLCHHTLLHASCDAARWSTWLGDMSQSIFSTARHLRFDGEGLSYQAAIEGLGMALGRKCLIAEALQSGHLVSPLQTTPSRMEGYYLTYPSDIQNNLAFRDFREWLLEQSEEFETAISEFHPWPTPLDQVHMLS